MFTTEPAWCVRVAHAVGEIDLATTDVFRKHLFAALAAAPETLIADLTGVSFFAVRGLSVLDELAEAGRPQRTQVRVVAADTAVTRVLHLFPLRGIAVHPFLHEALNHSLELDTDD